MDKHQFLKIVQDFTGTSPADAEALASLRRAYPFSQAIQTLAARASRDHGLPNQQTHLQVAAVYSSDRSLLKEIMSRQPSDTVQQVVSHQTGADVQTSQTVDNADVADVVMDDLDRLSRLKDTFETLFMGDTDESGSEEPAADVQEAPKGEEKPSSSLRKSKKERIIEMAKAVTTSPATKKKPKQKSPVDELITEIELSKSEIEPESETQKEQIELIDQFIAVQPSISNPRERPPSNVGDLATIKSGEFGDNIVSETLAEILIQQGKKDRAIEVLKKLIWKYPQKKAYFASQIESLKK